MPKISSYSGFTPILTDLLYGVDDPGGTPVSNKCTFADARTLIEANLVSPVIAAAANTAALVATGYSLTGSDATSMIDLAGTWNTTGTPTALKLNITDTASNASSLLLDLQVGGSSVFNIIKGGNITLASGADISSSGNITITNGAHQLFFSNTSGNVRLGTSSTGSVTSLSKFVIRNANALAFDTGNGSGDVFVYPDNNDILAQRNGTTAQEFRVYGTYGSATDYHRLAIKTAKTTLSSVTGASVTATNLIPDGAVVVGVTTKVTTGLGTSNGTTGYDVGDGTDVDRWGAITGTAAGTSSDNRDWTATAVQAFTSANNVVLTAVGGNFDGTGVIDVSVQYLIGEVD